MNIFEYPHIKKAILNVRDDLKYKNEACVEDWYKEMHDIASRELGFLKQNPEYRIPTDAMYIIETLAYIENYGIQINKQTEEQKRTEYYTKAIAYKNFLPRCEEYRFLDGTYMASWYQKQKIKIQKIVRGLEKDTFELSENNFELLNWICTLHADLKEAWLQDMLGSQYSLQNSEKYKQWQQFSEVIATNPKLLSTKQLCQSIEVFYAIEEFFCERNKRIREVAEQNFCYSKINMDLAKSHLNFKNM